MKATQRTQRAKEAFAVAVRRWQRWALFWLGAVAHGWRWRRECAWCHRWLGGNPLARRVTDGICADCMAAMMVNLKSEQRKV